MTTICRLLDCEQPAIRNLKCRDHINPVLPDPTWDAVAYQADKVARAEAASIEEARHAPAMPEPGRPLVIIPCGSAKAATASPPARLYTSAHFRAGAAAALAITTPDRVLILSAKYGFIRYDSDRLFEPYDETITASNARADHEARHRDRVVWQRRAWGMSEHLDVVALLPRRYMRVAIAAFPALVDVLAGCRGIGDQRARLLGIAKGAKCAKS